MVPFIDIGKMSSDLVNDSALQGPMSFVGQMTFKVRHTLCNFTIQVIVRDSCNLRLESCTNASFRVPPTGYRLSAPSPGPSELRQHALDHRFQLTSSEDEVVNHIAVIGCAFNYRYQPVSKDFH